MEIKFKLPDWTDERHLFVIAGQEPVLKRIRRVDKQGNVTYTWYKKAVRCNLCGRCCMNLKSTHRWGVDENGTCLRLIEGNPGEFWCDPNKGSMPWDCLKGDNEGEEFCCLEWEIIDGLAK